MPSQWELMAVPEAEDHEKLAREVQALFRLPKRASELHKMGELPSGPTCTAMSSQEELLATTQFHLCLLRHLRNAMREDSGVCPSPPVLGREKRPPPGGRPHLLVESVKELQEEMRCYLSFSDEEVLKGMIPLEETSAIPTEEADPQSTTTPASTPEEEAIMGVAREPAAERRSPKFPG